MPKGILKHAEDTPAAPRGIKWDEDNLMITEAGKGATMKITEPKTPYIHYDSANDLLLGSSGSVPPMELSSAIDDAKAIQDTTSRSDTDSQSSSRRRVSVNEWDDSDDEEENMDPEEMARHKKFEELRASHYDMKRALQSGKKEEEDLSDEGGDTSASPSDLVIQGEDESEDADDEMEESNLPKATTATHDNTVINGLHHDDSRRPNGEALSDGVESMRLNGVGIERDRHVDEVPDMDLS
ncbi:hypothetical protein HKX48_003240 [Thoreauomyces humboldtii]|nr:hypothetical protein HKX48_003240 [Thoreauomyces humboldtii]